MPGGNAAMLAAVVVLRLAQGALAQPCHGNIDVAIDIPCGTGFANKTNAYQVSSALGAVRGSPASLLERCCKRVYCVDSDCDDGNELLDGAACKGGGNCLPTVGVAANDTICCTRTVLMEELMLDLANEMANHLGVGFLMMLDILPHTGSVLSFLSGTYVVLSNRLQNEDDTSLLEEVFSLAAGCTGLASLIALTSIRITNEVTDEATLFCQVEGAGVTYFQLCTVMWLTAGANSVYKYVCFKDSSDTVDISLEAAPKDDGVVKLEMSKEIAALNEAKTVDAGPLSPSKDPTQLSAEAKAASIKAAEIATLIGHKKEIAVLKFYTYVCMGIPALNVGMMVLLGEFDANKPSFSFQRLGETGWCTINMNSPIRTFLMFYL